MAESAPVNDVLCSAVEYLVKLGANLRQRSETLKYKRIRKEKLKNTLAVQKAASKVLVLCELSKKSIVTVESSLNKILSQITTLQGKANYGKSSSSENISSYEYFEHDSRRLKIRKMVDLNHYTSAKVVASAMSTSLESKYDVYYDCKLFRLRKKAKSNEERHENSNKISEKNNSDTCKSVQFNDNIIICGKTQDESKDTCDTSSDGAKRTLNCKRSSENNLKKDKIPGYEDNPCSHMEQDSLQHNSDKMTTQDEIGKNGTESCTMNSSLNETLSEPDQVEKESDSANEVHLKNRKEQNNDQPQPEICSITNYDSDNQSEDSNSSMKSYIKCVNINSLLRPDIIPKVLSPVAIDSDSDDYPIKNPKPKRKSYKTYRNSKHQKEKVTHKFKPCKFKINITRLPKLTPQYLESKNLSRIIQNGTVICEVLQTTETNKSMFNSDKPNVDRDKIQLDDDILETKRSLLLNSDSDEDSRNVNELNKNALLCDADSDKVNPKETSPDNNRNNSIETTHTKEHIVDKDSEKSYNIDSITNKKKEEEETKLDSQRVLLTPDITKENDNDDDVDHATDSAEKETTECIETSASKEQKMLESAKKQMLVFSSSSSSDTDDELMKNVYENIRKNILREDSPEEDSTKRSDSESSKSNSSNTSSHNGKKTKKRKLTSKETEENRNSSKMDSNGKSSGSCDDTNNEDKALNGLTNLRTLKRSRRQRTEKRDRFRDYRMAKMPKVPVISDVDLLEPESSSDVPSPAANEDYEELPSISVPGLNGDDDTFAKEDLLGGSDTSASETENKNSQDDKANSEEENVKSKRRKANALSSGSEAGSSRRQGQRMSDFEDSEDDGSETMKRKRKKNKRTDEDSEGSGGSSDGKKKRRRIKNIDDSDGSGSETENEGRNKHGRKNIRKVMGKNQLEEATKKAAREEKERMARIAERQKLYNNLQFDESGKPDEVVLDKVVLDFDPDTKEPIIEVDKGLVKKLKPHQANGIKFMWDACFESVKRIKKGKGSGCILAHCMGLGKTLQVVSLTHTLLTHGDLTNVNRVLVVCPLSTVLNWVNEFKMWLKHSLTQYEVDVYELSRYKQNSDRAFQLSQWYQHGGVCVLGYEMFRNLSSDSNKKFKKKMLKNFQESLVDPGPDLVVCDEGHLLKNEKTSLSQAMNKVKTLRRIVLTGTPLQNNLKEYYCMVQFVKPNLLGKYNEYLNRFVNPITNGQYTDSTEHDIKIMKRRSHVLHKMLDGAVQRRDYGVLAPFLPPKHEYVLFITLNEVQVKLYTHYLDNYSRRPLPGKSSGFLFPDFQSLQRIWTHPLVLKYNSERYEIMQQKKREREEEDSEGSLVDFINDDSTPEETSTEESTDDSSDMSDDSRKKKKKKSPKKSKGRSTRRATRANPVEAEEDDVQEVIEVKNENPTEWWMSLVNEEELDDMRNSHKLVLLFDILRQCEAIGDKLLVFSQSLYSLDLIEHFLGKVDEATQEGRVDEKLGSHVGSWSPGVDYFRLDGSTSCENRSIWCKNFNREDNPRARLFLISTRAGGLGINLVAANRVVIFDVSWNPSHDVQSIFRVYRFGQKKPCYVYRFLVMGTMEEKIYERQVTKQAISKRVIDEQQIDRHYAENDLAELYKFEPQPPQPRPIPPLPKDRLFAEMLKEHEQLIYKYHEHDSLLENKEEETLTEEERKAAWEDFENEKTRPPPAVFAQPYAMHNGMMLAQQQQLAYAALAATLRKEAPTITENQIRDMIPLIYGANPQLMQKLGEMYKYPQSGMMNPGMMNAVMNSAAGGGSMSHSASTGLQYEPPWQRQQQMRLQQLMQQQNQMGAKFYAGGLGSRDPVAMALQHQRAREMMLGERTRPRGRPPHRDPAPRTNSHDVVNLDSD